MGVQPTREAMHRSALCVQLWALGERTFSGQVSVASLGGLTPISSEAYGSEAQQFLGILA